MPIGAPGAAPASQAGQADDLATEHSPVSADGIEAQPQPGSFEPEQTCEQDAVAPENQWPSWVPSLRNVCLGLLGGAALAVAGVRQLLLADTGFEEAWRAMGTPKAVADNVDHGRTLAAIGMDAAAAGAALGEGCAMASELRDTVRASSNYHVKEKCVSLLEALQAPPPLFSNKRMTQHEALLT